MRHNYNSIKESLEGLIIKLEKAANGQEKYLEEVLEDLMRIDREVLQYYLDDYCLHRLRLVG